MKAQIPPAVKRKRTTTAKRAVKPIPIDLDKENEVVVISDKNESKRARENYNENEITHDFFEKIVFGYAVQKLKKMKLSTVLNFALNEKLNSE